MNARAPQVETDVVLRLLDHQLVGPDGSLLGNVDDLELLQGEEAWLVTGIMVGPAALSRRLPGLLGQWVYAVWRRLHPAEHPAAVVVPIEHVAAIGSAVHVDKPAAEALPGTFGLELWLREHVVSRLPGVTGRDLDHERDRSERASHDSPSTRPEVVAPLRPPLEGSRGLSMLLGRNVVSYAGTAMGRACDLRCTGPSHDVRQEPLRARWLLYTPRVLGWQLGYSGNPDQGPSLLRRLAAGRRHRDRIVGLEQLGRLDALDGNLVLTHSARPAGLGRPEGESLG